MNMVKIAGIFGLTALMLQGCVTSHVNSKTNISIKTTEHDHVRYMLNYVSADGTPRRDLMVILGDKYTYELNDTYDDGKNLDNLNNIGKVLDLKHFKPEPIEFTVRHDRHDTITDNRVFFHFSYDKPENLITAQEKELLDRYCYTDFPKPYGGCKMTFSVAVYDKTTPPNATLQPVKGTYPIHITHLRDDKAKRALLTPFAFVADVVTAPLQLIYLGMLLR